MNFSPLTCYQSSLASLSRTTATAMLAVSLILTSLGCSQSSKESQVSKQDTLEAGLAALRVFDFEQSYEIFQQLNASVQKDEEMWPLVTYSFGVSAWLKTPTTADGVAEAVRLLDLLSKEKPKSIYTASALLDLGRITEISNFRGDTTDVVTARRYYERVRAEFPNTEMAIRATLFLAQTYVQTLSPADIHKAIDLLDACIQEPANAAWVGLIAQYIGVLYEQYLDHPKKAIDPYMQAAQAGLARHADTDSVLWHIGVLAERAGRDQLAAKAYSQIISDFPRTVYRSVSQERLEQIQKEASKKETDRR